jgi:hypothetical protein
MTITKAFFPYQRVFLGRLFVMIVLDILHCEVAGVGLKVINEGRLQTALSLNRRRLNDWSVNGRSLIVRVKRARSPINDRSLNDRIIADRIEIGYRV